MSYFAVDAVEVHAWGERVGAVALDDRLGYYVFEYYPDWARRGTELAPGVMPANGGPFVFPNLPESTFHRLPAMLADSLPDDFGNALIDAWLAQHGVQKAAVTALDRLAYMASRGMGALELRPSRGPRHRVPSAVELSSLVEGARSLIAGELGNKELGGDRETEAAIQHIIQVGTSAGGARAKAVIAWNEKTKEIRSGQLPTQPGFEHWLIKLDGLGRDDELGAGGSYGRIEYGYHLMAEAAGIRMMDCELLEENGRAHFMTKRFDRDGAHKSHVLTLCGLRQLDFRQRGTHDYSQLFQAAGDLALGPPAREEIFRRMVFNVAARNCDDHTKNHSFVLDGPDAQWRLSPAYDVTFAYNPDGAWTYQHLMSVNGSFRDISRDDLLAVADRQRVPRARAIISEVTDAVADWPQFAAKAGLSGNQADAIRQTFPTLRPGH
jgi:serine/threonine-protein kinase HipA